MNKPLFELIIATLEEEPRRLMMDGWVALHLNEADADLLDIEPDEIPPCGTAGCIAGWAVLLGGDYTGPEDVEDQAIDLLEIDVFQAQNLFFEGNWPWEFHDAYYDATSAAERTKVAIERIRYFIKTDGTDHGAEVDTTRLPF